MGLYYSYIFKRWADEKKEEEDDSKNEQAESTTKFCGCFSLDTGVKLIAGLIILTIGSLFIQGIMFNDAELRKLWIVLIFPCLPVAYVMIMNLAIKDNDTLNGRKLMFISYLVFIGMHHYLYYTMIYNKSMWGTTIPHALCKEDK